MIVVDASIVAPMVLDDEPSLPSEVAARLAEGPLLAPAHWPLEMVNMLHVAERRKRLDRVARDLAIGFAQALGVTIVGSWADRAWDAISRLADDHRLTLYDASYLDLALRRQAALATLDKAMIAAARARSVELVTY